MTVGGNPASGRSADHRSRAEVDRALTVTVTRLRPLPGSFAGAGIAPTGLGLVERRGEHGDPARGLIAPGRAAGCGRGIGNQVGAAGAGVGDGDERRREGHVA